MSTSIYSFAKHFDVSLTNFYVGTTEVNKFKIDASDSDIVITFDLKDFEVRNDEFRPRIDNLHKLFTSQRLKDQVENGSIDALNIESVTLNLELKYKADKKDFTQRIEQSIDDLSSKMYRTISNVFELSEILAIQVTELYDSNISNDNLAEDIDQQAFAYACEEALVEVFWNYLQTEAEIEISIY